MTENPLAVYVPQAGSVLETLILPKSAIVGTREREYALAAADALRAAGRVGFDPATEGSRIVIDFEGNRYGAVNMRTFADRCVHAAGRHVQHYATVARMSVSDAELLHVGWFDGNVVTVDNSVALASWLEVDLGADFDAELMRS